MNLPSILENIIQVEDASLVVQKILKSLRKSIVIDGDVSSSIGISMYPKDANNDEELLKYADIAMYRVKYEGRSNFQFYS